MEAPHFVFREMRDRMICGILPRTRQFHKSHCPSIDWSTFYILSSVTFKGLANLRFTFYQQSVGKLNLTLWRIVDRSLHSSSNNTKQVLTVYQVKMASRNDFVSFYFISIVCEILQAISQMSHLLCSK